MNETVLSQIPQRIKHFIDEQTIAGAVTLVAHGDDLIEFHALGMADIEAGRPMQKDTIFQIMSMTNPVTAIGIMMLAEEGRPSKRKRIRFGTKSTTQTQQIESSSTQRISAAQKKRWAAARAEQPSEQKSPGTKKSNM